MLRYLLHVKTTLSGELNGAYLPVDHYELAVLRGHGRILECLFDHQHPHHIKSLALLAIELGRLNMAKFLLDRRGESGPFLAEDVRRWIEGCKLQVLEVVASVVDTHALGCSVIHYTRFTSVSLDIVRALLLMSSAHDIAKTLAWTALHNREATECIPASASASLPSDAVVVARRLMDEAARGHDTAKPSYYAWIVEGSELWGMKSRLWRAENPLLEYDATRHELSRVFRDAKFSGLCLDLCSTPKSRICLENHRRNYFDAHVDPSATLASIVWSAAMSSTREDTTNNQAEHVGLITGLQAAIMYKWAPLEVIGDSQMIIRQMQSYRPPLQQVLRDLYGQACRLADRAGVRLWHHHRRHHNTMADAAANIAMNDAASSQVKHPTERVKHARLADHLATDFNQWQTSRFAYFGPQAG